MAEKTPSAGTVAPVRGALRLSVAPSSPQVSAGKDFSIFVLIQNPFDVPVTIYNTRTHIPVELIDVNALRRAHAIEESGPPRPWWKRALSAAVRNFRPSSRWQHSGIATAVDTSFDPEAANEFVKLNAEIGHMYGGSSVIGLQLNFPENPTAEELDRVFSRIEDRRRGLLPVTLQPGDSIVKQFVLCTRRWLLFTPLSHVFQIQVDYSADGADHAQTVAHEQNIRATLGAVAIGAAVGAVGGVLLKSMTGGTATAPELLRAIAAATIGSVAVVVAFARKASAQPIISVEDFWGGALIGFTVGFFGFERFAGLFGNDRGGSAG